jgi:two-component system sensor histidine kinase QseC
MMAGVVGASLQRRLLWRIGGGVAALWLVVAALVASDAHHELGELLDAHLAQAAALLVTQQAGSFDDNDDDLLDAPVLHRYAPRVTFQVWHQGELVLRSPNAPTLPLGTRTQGFETRTMDGRAWRLFAAQGAEADVQVWVGEDTSARWDILGGVLRGLLLPLLLGLPLIGLMCWWVIRSGFQPLRHLTHTLSGRSAESLEALPEPAQPLPAEIAPLQATLNALFARVRTLLESERRFTADAAHELRTPIAAVRTQAQVALGATEEGERRHALEATLLGCDRASHLVQQLLTLSRLEAQGLVRGTCCDLAALAQRQAADLALVALERQQNLSLVSDGPCRVQGDEALLGVLLRNLLDNALRYSPAGASIEITVQSREQGPWLRVEDSGPGLPPEALARLGERFFRVLGSGADGSGLGWSIVRRIASVHLASVQVQRSESLGGLSVAVQFPSV